MLQSCMGIESQRVNDLLIAPYGLKKDRTAHTPNPTQQKVLDWVDKVRNTPLEDFDHIPVLYVQGGNGSGKTRAIMAPVIEMLTSIDKLRILWGRMDFKDIKLSVMDKFFEVLPRELIASKSEQYHYYDIRQPDNGLGRIYFNGLKDLSGFGSQEFAIVVITEAFEITEQIYRTLKRRCRQADVPCMILMESEPPNQTHWLEDVTNPESENYDKDIEKWEVTTYENWDNLTPAYRGSLESMPEAAKRKYIYGKSGFSVSGKPFYSGYNNNLHAGEFEYIPGRPLLIGWDFGFHFPVALITQMDAQDRWIWLREIMGRDITIHKFGDRVIRDLNLYYPGSLKRHFGDPACNQSNDQSELTSKQVLSAKDISVTIKGSTYRERKEIIEGKLSTLHGDKPALLVDSRNCPIACDGFMGGYHYPQHKADQEYDDSKFELPYKDGFYDHVMNAGEYIAVNMFKAFERKVAKTRHPKGRV